MESSEFTVQPLNLKRKNGIYVKVNTIIIGKTFYIHIPEEMIKEAIQNKKRNILKRISAFLNQDATSLLKREIGTKKQKKPKWIAKLLKGDFRIILEPLLEQA